MKSELTNPAFSGNDIVSATGGTVITGRTDKTFHGISTDSRHISPGNLFIPIKGEKFDGHNFIADAVRDGAAGFLTHNGSEKTLCQTYKDITIISVPDTLTALGDIAHFWRNKCNASIIAITGSSGKTTTKEMAAAIAGLKKNVIKSQGNFNNLVGLPLTIFRINDRHETAILELGTNRRGEIGRLTDIAAPDIGLITNIGPAHMEGLKSLDIVREEKCDLFRHMGKTGVAIINLDDEKLLITDKEWEGNTVTFGFRKDANVSADNITSRGIEGVRFTIKIGEFRKDITMSTVGNHNITNALAAAASSWALGIDFPTICQGLTAFQPISGRMEIRRLENGAFIIDDTYNANPASFREALKTVKDLKGEHNSTVIMGDMLELGDKAEEMHEGIGSLMADTGVETIFLRGRLSQATAAGALKRKMAKDQIIFFETPEEILPFITSHVKKGDFILVKGSRRMRMEEVVQEIIAMFGYVKNQGKE